MSVFGTMFVLDLSKITFTKISVFTYGNVLHYCSVFM